MARTECQLFKLMKDHFYLLVLENSKGKVLDERGKADTSYPFWHTDALYYSQYADRHILPTIKTFFLLNIFYTAYANRYHVDF